MYSLFLYTGPLFQEVRVTSTQYWNLVFRLLCLNILIFMVPSTFSPTDVLHQGYLIYLSSLYLLLFLVHLDIDTMPKPIT